MIGLIGKKVGMSQIFKENGDLVPVTLLEVKPNTVIGKRTLDKNGYNAVIVGAFDVKEKHLTKPEKGLFKNVDAKASIKEFRCEDVEAYEEGKILDLENLLKDVKYVDVTALSKGKGFQGVMKRWGFHGGRATHGSKFHRQNGSTGQNTEPSRAFKGTKRAGRTGFEKITVMNLEVIKMMPEDNMIAVCGSVPGRKNSEIVIRKAIKK